MKKIFALIIIFAIWYFAGMNTQSAVLASVISIIIAVLISFIFSRIMRNKINVYIPQQKNLVFKNREASLKLTAKNKSPLPLNRFTIKIEMKYRSESKGYQKKLNSSAVGCNDGETAALLYYTAPYCGVVEVSLKRLRIFDYLGIFSNSKKLCTAPYEIFVLPEPKNINLLMPSFGTYASNPIAESSSDNSGDDYSEIRVLREYRDGDLMRHIHRNLSTRTEKLWIKEYNKENDYIFDLVLDTSDAILTTELLDALYELIFSILDSLTKNEVLIKFHWYDKNSGGIRNSNITNRNNLSKIIPELYKSDMKCTGDEFNYAIGNLRKTGMLLNAKLEWYFKGEHIYSFNIDNTEKELAENVFDLRR